MSPNEYTIIQVGGTPERFATLAADHAKWRGVASHLYAAAELLWPTIDAGFRASADNPADPQAAEKLRHRGPFYLLIGLAVENFAKALIVQQKNRRGEQVTNGDALAVIDGNHNLDRLVREAGIIPTDGERDLLDQLSRFVRWRGRYPVPKRAADMQKNTTTSTKDMQQIRRLFQRLEQQYQAQKQSDA